MKRVVGHAKVCYDKPFLVASMKGSEVDPTKYRSVSFKLTALQTENKWRMPNLQTAYCIMLLSRQTLPRTKMSRPILS